jgi:hypothetical protein
LRWEDREDSIVAIQDGPIHEPLPGLRKNNVLAGVKMAFLVVLLTLAL